MYCDIITDLLFHLLNYCDMDNSMPTDIDVLTAYAHIIKAWTNVKNVYYNM